MRALLFSFFTLALAAASQADFVSWTKRIGSGAQDQAGQVAVGPQGLVYTTSSFDGNLIVAKLDPANGSILWSRNLSKATSVDIKTTGNHVIVVANAMDFQSRPHAELFSISAADGSLQWFSKGIGGLETGNSKAYAMSVGNGRITIAGSQDGMAVVAGVQPDGGAWTFQTWLDGSLARTVVNTATGALATSEGSGQAWVHSVLSTGQIADKAALSLPAMPGARFQNARAILPNGSAGIWVCSEMDLGADRYLFATFSSLSGLRPTYVGTKLVPNGLELLAAAAISGAAYPGDLGTGQRLKVAARSSDALGNLQRREWVFGPSSLGGPSEIVLTSPLFISGYSGERPVGSVFLQVRGWDFATRKPDGSLQAFDGGLSADDTLVGVSDTSLDYAFLTTFRNGRSEARLLSLRRMAVAPSQIIGGQSVDIPVNLSGPAPAGGLSIAAKLPSGAPVQLTSSTILIPEGASSGKFTVRGLPVDDVQRVAVSFTCRGDTAIADITVKPTQLASLSVAPGTVVGCTSVTGRVTLNAPAPAGGYVVTLAESSTILDTDDRVLVPQGQMSADFIICTFATRVDASPQVTASDRWGSFSRPITVLRPSLTSLKWDLPTVRSNATVCARVRLNAVAPAGGFVVQNDTVGAIRCPGSVTITSAQQEAQITATTLPVSSPTRSTLTVSLNGKTMTASITVVP